MDHIRRNNSSKRINQTNSAVVVILCCRPGRGFGRRASLAAGRRLVSAFVVGGSRRGGGQGQGRQGAPPRHLLPDVKLFGVQVGHMLRHQLSAQPSVLRRGKSRRQDRQT